MRRLLIGLWLVGMVMAGLVAGAHAMRAAAQDATPGAEASGPPVSFELGPGVVADNVVFVEGQENPSLYRLHFDAGVVYPVQPGPSLEVIYMEAGSLTATLDGAVTVGQLGDPRTPGEAIPANIEFVLETGQFFVMQPGVSGEVRNEGDDTATVSVAGLTPAGASLPAATPAGYGSSASDTSVTTLCQRIEVLDRLLSACAGSQPGRQTKRRHVPGLCLA